MSRPLSKTALLALQLFASMREEKNLPLDSDPVLLLSLVTDALDLLEPISEDGDESPAENALFLSMGFRVLRDELETIQHQREVNLEN